ncbi:hypothetical protein [Neobacillus mesonae]|uniref:hypothetical protein n=1 Tax=Neobacillus mesonae TaxID=1193713 RepID=UPI00203D3F87|nr:hypothetical protein [Neobacillus mesonae]MCM3567364.1 hypothetical protein [Neobacillus mesonae]
MLLRGVRWIQRIIGVLFLAGGVYLIFVTQEFFGTLLIILAFLIFPTVEKKDKSTNNEYGYSQERYNEAANDYDSPCESGDSDSSNASGGDRD